MSKFARWLQAATAGSPATDAPQTQTQTQTQAQTQTHTGSTLSALRAVMVVAVVAPAMLFGFAAVYLHQREGADAQSQVDSAARISEEHALKIFETNVALINRVLDTLGDDDDAALLAREAALHQKLRRMTAGLPQLQGIFVMASTSHMLASDRVFPAPHNIDYSDRSIFKHHRAGGSQPFFTDVLTSRATGEPFFDLSLRRMHADGSFAGLVSTSMLPAYFAGFYAGLAGSEEGVNVALLRADGAVLARWPQAPRASDQPGGGTQMVVQPPGTSSMAEVVELPNGRRGLFASRRVGDYPIHVTAWVEEADAYASWNRQMLLLAGMTFPTALALVYITHLALQRTRRALEIADALRQETAQRERAEEALRQAQKLEAMGRLTGGVAHDFNNLLTVISNNAYLLKRLGKVPDDNTQLAAIDRSVGAGVKLTRQLLSFSRRQALRPEVLSLPHRLPAIVEMIAPALGVGITVQASVDAHTAPILVDAAELELAMLNLAINAKDAMPAGGLLHISACNTAQAQVAVSVRDSGQGIPAAVIDRVFEPFFTTKPVGHGTGLGLSQVYGFCQRAGGSVTVRSTPGDGTTVCMLFPQAPQAAAAEGDAAAALPDSLLGLRVLLVEDNDDVASATRAVLEAMGAVVRHVASADDALAHLQAQPAAPDVLVSDIRMPGSMDGIALAERLRSQRPELAVVLMSGYSESMERAAELALDVLHKPCAPAALAGAIHAAIQRSQQPAGQAASRSAVS